MLANANSDSAERLTIFPYFNMPRNRVFQAKRLAQTVYLKTRFLSSKLYSADIASKLRSSLARIFLSAAQDCAKWRCSVAQFEIDTRTAGTPS